MRTQWTCVFLCARRAILGGLAITGALVILAAVGEVLANMYVNSLPADQFKTFASLAQYEKKVGRNSQFSYQGGFGIYPTPGYSAGANKHNSMGFRGEEIRNPKPPNVARIACLGGSTTYDVQIDDFAHTWPAQLESSLRKNGHDLDVVNAGCPGWTSREQILNFATRVSYTDPDLVVIYDGINDLIYRANWPSDTLRSDYTSPYTIAPEFAKPSCLASFALFRIPMILTGRMTPPCSIEPFWIDVVKSQGFVNIFSTMRPDVLGRYLPIPRRSSVPPGMTLKNVFETNSNSYFARNLESIVACAKQRHAKVLLVGFIMNWQTLDAECTDHGEALKLGVDQFNAVSKAVAEQQGVAYYDLPRDWPQGGQYWAEFVHNNDAGALLKAQLISDFILKADLLPG